MYVTAASWGARHSASRSTLRQFHGAPFNIALTSSSFLKQLRMSARLSSHRPPCIRDPLHAPLWITDTTFALVCRAWCDRRNKQKSLSRCARALTSWPYAQQTVQGVVFKGVISIVDHIGVESYFTHTPQKKRRQKNSVVCRIQYFCCSNKHTAGAETMLISRTFTFFFYVHKDQYARKMPARATVHGAKAGVEAWRRGTTPLKKKKTVKSARNKRRNSPKQQIRFNKQRTIISDNIIFIVYLPYSIAILI